MGKNKSQEGQEMYQSALYPQSLNSNSTNKLQSESLKPYKASKIVSNLANQLIGSVKKEFKKEKSK